MSGILQTLLVSGGETRGDPKYFEPEGSKSGSGATATIPAFSEKNVTVVLAFSVRTNSNPNLTAAGFTELYDLYANAASMDCNLGVYYKQYPNGNPEAETVTLSHSGYWATAFLQNADIVNCAQDSVTNVKSSGAVSPILIVSSYSDSVLRNKDPFLAVVAGACSYAGGTAGHSDIPGIYDDETAIERYVGGPSTGHNLQLVIRQRPTLEWEWDVEPLMGYDTVQGESTSTQASCAVSFALGLIP